MHLSFLLRPDIWMILCVICTSDVLYFDDAISIGIKSMECFLNQLFSEWVHVTLDCSDEFIEIYYAVIIFVEEIKKSAALLFAHVELKVA